MPNLESTRKLAASYSRLIQSRMLFKVEFFELQICLKINIFCSTNIDMYDVVGGGDVTFRITRSPEEMFEVWGYSMFVHYHCN